MIPSDRRGLLLCADQVNACEPDACRKEAQHGNTELKKLHDEKRTSRKSPCRHLREKAVLLITVELADRVNGTNLKETLHWNEGAY